MKLQAYIKRLDSLSSAQSFVELKERIGEAGLKLIRQGFETETDPYGKKWKYVKDHPGHQSTLVDTGDLRDAWKAQPITDGVRFSNDMVYANKQNYTRPMIPTEAQGLPAPWKSAITKAFNKLLNDKLKESL